MSWQAEVTQIEDDLQAAGASLAAVLTEVGVHRTTWMRWKGGDVHWPRYETMVRVREVVKAALAAAQREAAA